MRATSAAIGASSSELPSNSTKDSVTVSISLCPASRFSPFPPELSEYLALSTAQVNSILQLNGSYDLSVGTKRRRIAELQQEIARETAKQALDPMAIGTRYVEIEELNRQIRNDRVALRDQNRAVLTDAQRARLQSLDTAGKQRPAISQAECEDLLEPAPTVGGVGTLSAITRSGDFSVGISEMPFVPLRFCQSSGFSFLP